MLGEALQRSASAFNTAHTDLDKSIAIITASNEVLQDPEKVGTMWNTVSARIRGAATELVDMGEETDEYVESTSKLRDLVKGYTGFDIMEDEENFKDLYEIVLGIGQAWGGLEDIQKAALGEALGGKRNARGLYSIFDHLDTLTNAYESSVNSAGSAMREQEHYAESVQYSIDRTKASLQELAHDFLSSDLLKGLIEGANTFLQIVDKIISSLGTVGTLLAGGGIASFVHGMATNKGILAGLFENLAARSSGEAGSSMLSNILATFTGSSAGRTIQKTGEGIAKNIGEGIERRGGYSIGDAVTNALAAGFTREVIPYGDGDFVEVWKNKAGEIVQETQGATRALDASLVESATQSGTTAGTGFASAFASAVTAHPLIASAIGIGIAAAVTAGIVAGVNKYQKEQRAKKGRATIESYEETKSQVEGYQERYITLKEGLDNAKTDADRLSYREQILSLQQEIVAQYGSEASAVDLVNGKLSEQVGIIGEIANSQMEKNMQDSDFRKYLKESTKEMESEGQFEVGVIVRDGTAPELEKDIDQIIERLQGEYGEDAIELSPTFSPTVDGEIETDAFTISGTKYQAKQIQDSLKSELERLSESYKGDEVSSAIIDNLLNGFSAKLDESFTDYGSGYLTDMYQNKMLKPQQELYDDYVESIRNLNLAFASGDDDTINQAIDAYAGYSDRIGTELKDFKPLTEKAYEQLDETSLKAHDLKEAISSDNVSQNNMFKDNIDDIKKYADVIKDANFSTQDIAEIFANPKVMTKNGQTALIELAKSMGILGEDITADNNILPTYIDLLSELGIAAEGASDKAADGVHDFSDFQSSIINDIANIDTLNAAIAESFTGKGLSYSIDENGEVVGSIAEIKKAYGDLMDGKGITDKDLFERTANGIHLNQQALRELNSQLEKNKKANLTKQETQLLEEQEKVRARIATLERAGTTDNDTYRNLKSSLETINGRVESVRELSAAYDGATSAYQKWVNAQSMGEEGDMYDALRDTAVKRGKELYDAGLVGTNEFRAIAQLYSDEDLSTAPISKLTEAYEKGSAAVNKYFTEGHEGAAKFLDDVDDLGMGIEKVGENNWIFDKANTTDLAKHFGVSVDMIESIFKKLSDYGFDVKFGDEETFANLEKIEEKGNSAAEALKKVGESTAEIDGKKMKLSEVVSGFDMANASVEEMQTKLDQLKTFEKVLEADPNVNTDELGNCLTLIHSIEEELGILDGTNVTPELTVDGIDQTQEVIDGLEEKIRRIQEINANGGNLDIHTDQAAMQQLEQVAQWSKEDLKTYYDIEVEKNDPENILEFLQNKNQNVEANVDANVNGENVREEVSDSVSSASGTPAVKVDEGSVTSQTQEGIKAADGTTVIPKADADQAANETKSKIESVKPKVDVQAKTANFANQLKNALKGATSKVVSGNTPKKAPETTTTTIKENKETNINTTVSGNAKEQLSELQSMASAPMNVKVNVDTNADVAVAKLKGIANTNLEAKVKLTPDDGEVRSWQAPQKTGMVKYFVNGGNVSGWNPPMKQGYVRYNVTGTSPVYNWQPPKKTGTVSYNVKADGTAHWQGTAGGYYSPKRNGSVGNSFINHYNGTAYAGGNWGLKQDEPNALINELGPEIVVRNGQWMIVNNGFPTLANSPKGVPGGLQKGDIVFNHKQAEDILKHGYVTGSHARMVGGGAHADGTVRGEAFPNGTVSGGGGFSGGITASSVTVATNKTDIASSTATVKADTTKTSDNAGKDKSLKKKDILEATQIDWIETRLKRIDAELEKTLNQANKTFRSFVKRVSDTEKAIGQVTRNIGQYSKAEKRYNKEVDKIIESFTGKEIKQAQKLGIIKKGQGKGTLKKKALEGAIDVSTIFIDDEKVSKGNKAQKARKALLDRIQLLQQLADKADEAKNKQTELSDQEKELYVERFNLIKEQWGYEIDNLDTRSSMLNTWIDTQSAKGLTAGTKIYDVLKGVEQVKKEDLTAERDSLQKQLDTLVNGKGKKIEKFSADWYEMNTAIRECNASIMECDKNIAELEQTQRQVKWDLFDNFMANVSDITNEISFLKNMLSVKDLFDDDGNATKEGRATLGLDVIAYETLTEQAKKYAKDIQDIESELNKSGNKNNKNLLDRLKAQREAQRSTIESMKSTAEDIKKFYDDMYKSQADSLKETIDEYLKMLDSQQDAYKYQQTIEEKMKNISSLRRQIASWSGDTSEEGAAKRQKTAKQLEDAEKQLREAQEDRRISQIKEMLNDLQDNFSKYIEERMMDISAILEDARDIANANLPEIRSTLTGLASELGYEYDISDPLSKALEGDGGKTTIASNVSSIVDALDNIQELLSDADKNASEVTSTITNQTQSAPPNQQAGSAASQKNNKKKKSSSTKKEKTYTVKQLKAAKKAANKAEDKYENTKASKTNNKKEEALKNAYAKEDKYKTMKSYFKQQINAIMSKGKANKKVDKKEAKKHGDLWEHLVTKYKHEPTNAMYKSIAKLMGVSMSASPKSKEKTELLKTLKKYGLKSGSKSVRKDDEYWTQEVGTEYIIRKSDGAMLTPLNKGDMVFTNEMSKNLWSLAKMPEGYFGDGMIKAPDVSTNINVGDSNVDITFNLPNVTNSDDFIRTLQKSKKFEQIVQSMTIGQLKGKGTLNKYNTRI